MQIICTRKTLVLLTEVQVVFLPKRNVYIIYLASLSVIHFSAADNLLLSPPFVANLVAMTLSCFRDLTFLYSAVKSKSSFSLNAAGFIMPFKFVACLTLVFNLAFFDEGTEMIIITCFHSFTLFGSFL